MFSIQFCTIFQVFLSQTYSITMVTWHKNQWRSTPLTSNSVGFLAWSFHLTWNIVINVLFFSFKSSTVLLPFTVLKAGDSSKHLFLCSTEKMKVIQDWKNMKWSKCHVPLKCVQVKGTELIWAVFTHTHTHIWSRVSGGQLSFIYFYIERLCFILSLSSFFQVTYYVQSSGRSVSGSPSVSPRNEAVEEMSEWMCGGVIDGGRNGKRWIASR